MLQPGAIKREALRAYFEQPLKYTISTLVKQKFIFCMLALVRLKRTYSSPRGYSCGIRRVIIYLTRRHSR